MSIQLKARQLRFSVDEYYKMIELGMLKDYEKSEIIEGELIEKMPIGDRHAAIVDYLNEFFFDNIDRKRIRLRVQNPIRLTDFNSPQPDLSLSDLTKYDGKRHPRPAEILLIVEVSDATLKYDRDVKIPLYAEAEIPEVWIINLGAEIVEIHSQPANGLYQFVKFFKRGEIVKSETVLNLEIAVDKILD